MANITIMYCFVWQIINKTPKLIIFNIASDLILRFDKDFFKH